MMSRDARGEPPQSAPRPALARRWRPASPTQPAAAAGTMSAHSRPDHHPPGAQPTRQRIDRREQQAADLIIAVEHPFRYRQHLTTCIATGRSQQHRRTVEDHRRTAGDRQRRQPPRRQIQHCHHRKIHNARHRTGGPKRLRMPPRTPPLSIPSVWPPRWRRRSRCRPHALPRSDRTPMSVCLTDRAQ